MGQEGAWEGSGESRRWEVSASLPGTRLAFVLLAAETESLRAGQLSTALLSLAFATERPVLMETSLGQASVGCGLLYLHTGLTCSPPWEFGQARPGVALHPLFLVHLAGSLLIQNQTPASVHFNTCSEHLLHVVDGAVAGKQARQTPVTAEIHKRRKRPSWVLQKVVTNRKPFLGAWDHLLGSLVKACDCGS